MIELDTSGNVAAYNIWGANGLIGRKTSSSTTYYLYDPQGTVAQTFDAGSAIQTTRMYDAWGNLMLGTHPSSDPYGYNGQWGYYMDNETGLLLLTHRYYDQSRGRFVTRDPIGDEGGLNLYSYVENNSVVGNDPLGYLRVKNCGNNTQAILYTFWLVCAHKDTLDSCMNNCPLSNAGTDCVSSLCSNPNLVIECQNNNRGLCKGACAYKKIGAIVICANQWTSRCKGLHCAIAHEMTHLCGQINHPSGSASECVHKVFPSCN